MAKGNIELIYLNDDWEKLVIGGETVLEGHSLPLEKVIEAVRSKRYSFTIYHTYTCALCDASISRAESDEFGERCNTCFAKASRGEL